VMKEHIALSIDPGSSKCGVAVVGERSGVLWMGIVQTSEVANRVSELVTMFNVDFILVGGSTGSRAVVESLLKSGLGVPVLKVDERFSTLEARRRYFKEHPPKGWRRFIPISLQTPPEPYDHYAAVVLAERYLSLLRDKEGDMS
jgi:RNase H-fold protein (predicted Holliday junction resolvase)